jgi:hypothetical protein
VKLEEEEEEEEEENLFLKKAYARFVNEVLSLESFTGAPI